MKALIKVGYGCNEHCTFCHTLDVRHIDGTAAEVHAKIDRAARLGHTMVVLSGGEPTIRPELFEWAAHVASLGLDFGLVTNGTVLSYPDVVERLLEHRLRYVYMSLHGGTAEVHNRMVRAHTFDHVRAALANLSGRGLDFTVNTVVARQNLEHLRGVVDLCLPYPDLTLKFSMLQPKGGGLHLLDALMPLVSDVAARVREAISYGMERASPQGPRFAHDGIPLCLLPGYEHLYDDLKTHAFWTMVEIGEPDFFPVDDKAKVQPEKCRPCALRGPCPGLYIGYHEEFGDGELRPVLGRPRSNSFHWIFEELVTTAAGDRCPLLEDGVTPWDRGRHLFVRHGERIARFRTFTRDFSDAEIEATKHDAGQVYLDRSSKPALDDFASDLVQLRRSEMCIPCPERAVCTGMFEPVFEDVFTRDDARVREIVASLCGDVLDLGCGDGRYEGVLAPRARAGLLRYLGIDPDAERVRSLRSRWPWAEVRQGAAESLGDADGHYDHVLVLRSWNHLVDPGRAVAAIARRLRPGGTLLIVDNVVFGLARTPRQAHRGEASVARFEHFRNDDAAQVHGVVAALGFELLERKDVGPATSNQWLLRYRAQAL
jgi:MoaA/NifB/PqqE/SkfB family radical SAM enzyme/SAM-dependent methyltransferase